MAVGKVVAVGLPVGFCVEVGLGVDVAVGLPVGFGVEVGLGVDVAVRVAAVGMALGGVGVDVLQALKNDAVSAKPTISRSNLHWFIVISPSPMRPPGGLTLQVSRWLAGQDQLPRPEPTFGMLITFLNRQNPPKSLSASGWAAFSMNLLSMIILTFQTMPWIE